MKKLLVSACLLGQPVRYDGANNQNKVLTLQAQLQLWQQQGLLIPVCPESLGGLPTPRPAAELRGGDGHALLVGQARVVIASGDDVTHAFLEGARRTLAIAQREGASAALLAARSPSCGNQGIYNGEFNRTLQTGVGVTVALLQNAGIRCFNPEQAEALQQWMDEH
ncbi:DUF523 domain-containing protein [Parathalassolituus penaei]|uniref:2-thiouracil desulfurase family protein n=1 Tax=Parathalassolituus penaei TaxID=2997323 RepID=A0A9X3EBZ7_9GAMM|nr:2-thiouracil desulfurase family protein [Parathalassolituus penaei]MCY0963895.1 2-thiouracil desulfurase family protein [Parathalassolituus penaei]